MSRRKLKTPDVQSSKTIVYCGAFSLMAITGKSHEQAKATLCKANRWRKGKVIKGLWVTELVRGFEHCGFRMTHVTKAEHYRKRPTLAKWVAGRRGAELSECYLVTLSTHFVIINGNEFIDTYTKTPVKLDDCPHRRATVRYVHRIKSK